MKECYNTYGYRDRFCSAEIRLVLHQAIRIFLPKTVKSYRVRSGHLSIGKLYYHSLWINALMCDLDSYFGYCCHLFQNWKGFFFSCEVCLIFFVPLKKFVVT